MMLSFVNVLCDKNNTKPHTNVTKFNTKPHSEGRTAKKVCRAVPNVRNKVYKHTLHKEEKKYAGRKID